MRSIFLILSAVLLGFTLINCERQKQPAEADISYDPATYQDVDYIPDTNYQDAKDKLDIYMPGGKGPVPVLLFFHGGGLEQGDKSDMEFAARRFLHEGIGVVFANYRLSPSVMHPAHMQDAARAFAWVKKNIGRYGGDSLSVFVS